MRTLLRVAALSLICCSTTWAQQLQRVAANGNLVPAGKLTGGVLTLRLNIVRATWHPDREIDPGIEAAFFAEDGHAPSLPAPLIRVPAGTEVRTTVRNTLPDSSVLILGLSGDRQRADSVRIPAGQERELVFRADKPGTYVYNGLYSIPTDRFGNDRLMGGALIIDETSSPPKDRVLVLHQLFDTLKLKPHAGTVEELLAINGKSWPHTERLDYKLGETIRWRIVNASYDTHPMHLHGAYYRVLSRGIAGRDTTYTAEQVRKVVTERMAPLHTMMMEWTPERAGNWLFHCHLTFHILPHAPIGELKASGDEEHGLLHGMGGLVLGTTIHGDVASDVKERRKLRLVVQEYDSIPGHFGPPFSYALDDSRTMNRAGPPIVVKRNEPIAITVVNRAKGPTAVHWHGLEIESYFDGVAGYGGTANRVTPPIAAADSFVVRMAPPRAGTFIYHTHIDEARQQSGGLYGAFVVLPETETWDPTRDIPIVFGTPSDTTNLYLNGAKQSTMELAAGKTYKLRLINVTLARPTMRAILRKGDEVQKWTAIAKDGFDLPAHQAGERAANQTISIGETYDMLFTPVTPGEYVLCGANGAGVEMAQVVISVR